MTPWTRIMWLAAVAYIVAIIFWPLPARPQEDRCQLIEKAVSIVGEDPIAIEDLARRVGVKITPARRAEARRCLRRIKWAHR